MQCRSHSRRRTIECLFVTACSMDQYAEEMRTEKNLIVRSGISEAETTNNKRLRSTFCIKAIQTASLRQQSFLLVLAASHGEDVKSGQLASSLAKRRRQFDYPTAVCRTVDLASLSGSNKIVELLVTC